MNFAATTVAIGLCIGFAVDGRAQSTLAATSGSAAQRRPWLEQNTSVDERVGLLIREMALEEKIGQLAQANGVGHEATGPEINRAARESLDARVRKAEVGSVLNEVDTDAINSLQRIAVKESRLGIPLIFGRDVIHGFRTIFPIPLGQAACWNPQLVEKAAAIAARETRSVGVHWTFAPMVDIARDARWGRIAESFGEDPYLCSQFSRAMVRGFQGNDLSSRERIAACAKHFAGYGAAEGGRDYNSAVISPSLMRNVYLPPFRAAVDEGVATLMTAFNDVNGVPGSANTHLLRDVLRKDWKFQGFVVSDWESIKEMTVHGYCRDEKDAALNAARAGVNMEMVSQTYHDHLAELVRNGEITKANIDGLVAAVLRIKMRLGLFERPYADSSTTKQLSDDHLKVARELAQQSIVMLKNEDRLLPLDKSKIKKLAIIGPLADDKRAQLGTWVPDARVEDSRTIVAAIRDAVGDTVQVNYVAGLSSDRDKSKAGFETAIAAARDSDAVLLVVGESADLSGEARSRAILDLPGAQNQLVAAVAETGKPCVLVIEAGRPITIGRQVAKVKSVLYAFHPGTMAGPAIADIILGTVSPSGKLPVTFPKTVGQIPLYYNHTNTGRPPRPYDFQRDHNLDANVNTTLGYNSNYIDVSPYPLFPFGYGLTYTTFRYGPIKISKSQNVPADSLSIETTVTNTGGVTSDETVQLYIHANVGPLNRPVRELKGFERIHLLPGQEAKVRFSLLPENLALFDNDEHKVPGTGRFDVYIGSDSTASRTAQFDLP